jgi:hypothetical protein
MHSASIMVVLSAAGHGIKDGTSKTERGTSMDRPFVSQWYWQESVMHPYKKTKAWYYGPREKWMKLADKKKTPPKEDWWERHKSYIEHHKEFPYYPEKNKK